MTYGLALLLIMGLGIVEGNARTVLIIVNILWWGSLFVWPSCNWALC